MRDILLSAVCRFTWSNRRLAVWINGYFWIVPSQPPSRLLNAGGVPEGYVSSSFHAWRTSSYPSFGPTPGTRIDFKQRTPIAPASPVIENRNERGFSVISECRPSVSIEVARSRLDKIFLAEYPRSNTRVRNVGESEILALDRKMDCRGP